MLTIYTLGATKARQKSLSESSFPEAVNIWICGEALLSPWYRSVKINKKKKRKSKEIYCLDVTASHFPLYFSSNRKSEGDMMIHKLGRFGFYGQILRTTNSWLNKLDSSFTNSFVMWLCILQSPNVVGHSSSDCSFP